MLLECCLAGVLLSATAIIAYRAVQDTNQTGKQHDPTKSLLVVGYASFVWVGYLVASNGLFQDAGVRWQNAATITGSIVLTAMWYIVFRIFTWLWAFVLNKRYLWVRMKPTRLDA